MNANLGIILKISAIEALLVLVPPVIRSWGESHADIDDEKYIFPPLTNTEFQLYPLTEFVQNRLPYPLKSELMYAWITGQALDAYEAWLCDKGTAPGTRHPFEEGLLELIGAAGEATMMFAPEGERLGEFVDVSLGAAMDLLRLNVKNLHESPGFMATVNV